MIQEGVEDRITEIDVDPQETTASKHTEPIVDDQIQVVFTEATSSELIDKVVSSEEEAYDLYNNYARRHGFGTRKYSTKYKQGTKILRSKQYCCCMSGMKNAKKAQGRKYRKLNVRTNCPAMIKFVVDSVGKWLVRTHIMEHNHPFVPQDQVHLLRSHRKVRADQLEYMSNMKSSGIQISKAYKFLSEASGGKDKVGFTQKDAYDALAVKRLESFDGKGANTLLETLKKRNETEDDFFYDIEVDSEGRVCSFFWRDGQMHSDYKIFGDLVVHDTTYRSNKYNMICAPFVGVNNHGFNIMFGCGFLLNEKIESFKWLFEKFLKSMNGICPQTIMTDQCDSKAAAIEKVFPNSIHRLGVWYLMENAKKYINSLIHSIDGFNDQFQYILEKCETVAEFNTLWARFLETYKCENNQWLKRLYEIRDKWCRAFMKDHPFGGVLSSQISESTNRDISRNLSKTSDLYEFYKTLDNVISAWRGKEMEEDLRCLRGEVNMVADGVSILSEARNAYTIKIYQLFEAEFKKAWACHYEFYKQEQSFSIYYVWQPKVDISKQTVTFNIKNSQVFCSCKLLMEVGILCSHSLRILNVNCVDKLDEMYILKRWRKDIPIRRKHEVVEDKFLQSHWLMIMTRRINEILVASASNENARDLCEKTFKSLKDEVYAQLNSAVHADPSAKIIDE